MAMNRLAPFMMVLLLVVTAGTMCAGSDNVGMDEVRCIDRSLPGFTTVDCDGDKCRTGCLKKHGPKATGDCVFFHDPNHVCMCTYPC